VLHEIVPASYADRPSAFGFAFALLVEAQRLRKGPAVFAATQRAMKDFGRPFSHGLRQLGVDPHRLVMIEARNDKDALWAMEEALRSDARPSMVMGANSANLDLTVSRRLSLAAQAHAVPLAVLRMTGAEGTNAAATRWCVEAAPATRNSFGALAHAQWRLTLERCRNGRPGQWLVEWNHVTHCFCLAEGVADRAPHAGAGLRRAG
jgi:protein ImuA